MFVQLISDIKETKLSDMALFPPPGFRTGSIIRMAIGLFAYIIFFVLLFSNMDQFKNAEELIDFVILYTAEIIFPMWLFGNRARQVRLIPGLRRLEYPGRLIASFIIYFVVDFVVCLTVPMPNI